jgi:hypothetical protein
MVVNLVVPTSPPDQPQCLGRLEEPGVGSYSVKVPLSKWSPSLCALGPGLQPRGEDLNDSQSNRLVQTAQKFIIRWLGGFSTDV